MSNYETWNRVKDIIEKRCNKKQAEEQKSDEE